MKRIEGQTRRAAHPFLLIVAVLVSGCSAFWTTAPIGADRFVEARFLVPLEDNHGVAFEASRFEWLEEELAQRFGGYTLEGEFDGGWRDDKRLIKERSRRYLVAIQRSRVSELLQFLRLVKKEFHQKSLYVSFTHGEVVFL